MTGIEPASEAWEASILPMNYIRSDARNAAHIQKKSLAQGCETSAEP